MTIRFFSGGAGCGKTYQVMLALSDYLQQYPMLDGQKVLALTYMHGSRRRLHERLSVMNQVANKFECLVIDSLAWRIVSRWRSLLHAMGFEFPAVGEFNRVCEGAALLLADEVVARWVAATYPVMILDEAQDLDSIRLGIVQGLARHIELIAAADEFQCLDNALRPNPTYDWLVAVGESQHLVVPHRTNLKTLLNAAHAIRSGHPPVSGGEFQIAATPNAGLAGSWLANGLAWYGRGQNVAIITPATGPFATGVTDWVAVNTNKKNNGPYRVRWEHSELRAITKFLDDLALPARAHAGRFGEIVNAAGDDRTTKDVRHWLDVQRRTQGRTEFDQEDVVEVIRQSFSNRKHAPSVAQRLPLAMTVHGAKNREFDMVVVLWPAALSGDAEQKRRLLYNAVTRAKSRCLVLVQARAALAQPPFA